MAKETTETKDTAIPKNDAYTGMLVISLLALIGGTTLLYLDWSQYPAGPQPYSVPAYTAPAPPPAEKGGEKGPDAGKEGVPNPQAVPQPGKQPMPPVQPEQKGGKG
jgi:hypothetical protein